MKAFLILPTLLLATPAFGHAPMLPPDLADKINLSDDVADVGEPPLWHQKALGHFQARYRLTIQGVRCIAYTIRLDERTDGKVLGTVKSWNGCKQDAPYEQRGFHLKAEQMGELKAAFAKAELWEISPQFWQFRDPKDGICIDGEEMTFERRDGAGYRVAQANAQCEAPCILVLAAQKFITLAGEVPALRLLN